MPHISIFRSALQVSPERIAAMSDDDLNLLMGELLQKQAYKCGAARHEIRVNTEENASDGGCDGWSPGPTLVDPWLGSTSTCWQFKAGTNGQPAKLVGEVVKRIPKETLEKGGRFVVVASGSTSGINGERARLKALVEEASAASIPTAKIDVIGSERLTKWCNQWPAVAARWAGRPGGLWILEQWLSSNEHQVPWQSSPAVESNLSTLRNDLDLRTGDILHLHIQGHPGVGKTRFALELCRGAAWCGSVIYIRQSAEVPVCELIDGVAEEADVNLVVVVDEVQPRELRLLRESVGLANGRVRLITIGHCPTPDAVSIPVRRIDALDDQSMRRVIAGWYPEMPHEHVDFVVRFADGYVRLARLAANAVAQEPNVNAHGLLSRDDIRVFLDHMLGTGERDALYVVAVLTSVGWSEDRQVEGETVARHLGLDWNTVRRSVHDFQNRLGIAPQGGRFRYISPTPLAIHLAIEAWKTFPDRMKSLPTILPTEESREAYYERLRSIASNPQAREFARVELGFFFRLDDFIDFNAVRRWSALSSADPERAARGILSALLSANVDDRKRIQDRARREAVWTLVRIAWRSSAFQDATKALALLAEAENETWANNASGEFIAKYQVSLGGTAAAYLDRLSVLDELVAEGRPPLTRLAVHALAQVGNTHPSRAVDRPPSDELPEREWNPSTNADHYECVEAAITRLIDIAKLGISEVLPDLLKAAKDLSMMLRKSSHRELVTAFFDALCESFPSSREPLRRTIAEIIDSERKYWKKLSTNELAELESLHGRFEDSTLTARLQQFVGHARYDRDEMPDLIPLAEELASTLDLFAEHWHWLTSGEAFDAWRLGIVLASVDVNGKINEQLQSLAAEGRDFRLVCGYVSSQRKVFGDDWYNTWVKSQCERDPKPISLICEIAWRCGLTASFAKTLEVLLRAEEVDPNVVGQMRFGDWYDTIPAELLEGLLRAMVESKHGETAIGILASRIKSKPDELERWKPLALNLTTRRELIRNKQMDGYHWSEVAKHLIGEYAGKVSAAIFDAHAQHDSQFWFIEHSNSANILTECVKSDSNGVWNELKPYLSDSSSAFRFCVGFPDNILELFPADVILSWVAEQPIVRSAIVAKLTSNDISTDDKLTSQVIGTYADDEGVASEFYFSVISGSWAGSSADHWTQLALQLDGVASRTTLPILRQWARKSAGSLRGMAERDRQREEEEKLRWS